MITRILLALVLAHYIVPLYRFVVYDTPIPGSTAAWACLFTIWYFAQLFYYTIAEEDEE